MCHSETSHKKKTKNCFPRLFPMIWVSCRDTCIYIYTYVDINGAWVWFPLMRPPALCLFLLDVNRS